MKNIGTIAIAAFILAIAGFSYTNKAPLRGSDLRDAVADNKTQPADFDTLQDAKAADVKKTGKNAVPKANPADGSCAPDEAGKRFLASKAEPGTSNFQLAVSRVNNMGEALPVMRDQNNVLLSFNKKADTGTVSMLCYARYSRYQCTQLQAVCAVAKPVNP